jgi:cytochrome b involved in lipid metabolism
MHPGAGGPAIILKNAGTDATMGFVKAKHSPKAMALRDGPPPPPPPRP